VGKNAAAIALGMGAEVTLLDINPDILKQHPRPLITADNSEF
jgi:alanine dehydrogenase